MVRLRRHIDAAPPAGVTSVLLVTGPRGGPDDHAERLGTACRDALRETDAVLERHEDGVTAVLLRHLRPGGDDIVTVTNRVRQACESAIGTPVRIGVGTAEVDDEPLDLLLHRARQTLEPTGVDPASTAST